jgi:hypothetical protein
MKPGMVVLACNPSTQKAEAEGSWVRGETRLHDKTLFQKKKREKEKETTRKLWKTV